ncbi:MAG: hypothetical protein RL701_2252 [Pseudomonadota bacterium]
MVAWSAIHPAIRHRSLRCPPKGVGFAGILTHRKCAAGAPRDRRRLAECLAPHATVFIFGVGFVALLRGFVAVVAGAYCD